MAGTSTRVAIRYAKSLISLASERNAIDQLHTDMTGLIELCANSRDFVVMLESPIITHEKKLFILEKIFSGKVHEITMAFFKLITKKSRESVLLDIANAYVALYNENKGLVIADLLSAVPLANDIKSNIVQKVSKAVGKQVLLKETVDESLIGGFILRLDDKQLDSSVRSQLFNLKKRLN